MNFPVKALLPILGISLIFCSCTETPGGKTGNDSIPVSVVPPPSNEIMTARLQEQLAGKYDNVWDYREGMIAVLKNGKYGFCDSTGKEVIPFLYTDPTEFKEGAAVVKKDGKIGFIDKTGKELFPLRDYDYAGGFEKGLSSFRMIKAGKELYGFVDKTGTEVIPATYDNVDVSWFGNGNAIVQKGGKWGTINRQNTVAVPFEYDELNEFSGGVTTASKAGKWGIIDSTGKVLVPFTLVYKRLSAFSNGYAVAESGKDLEGFIDVNGKEVLGGLKYREAFPFGETGHAIVSENNDPRYMIDKDGNTLFKGANIEDISPLDVNMFLVKRNGMQGIVDKDNKELLPVAYSSILPMGSNLLLVVKDDKRFYADYKGNKVADYTEQ